MAQHVEEVICYKHDGKLYETFKEAEEAAFNAFGEELNEVLKNSKNHRVSDLAYGLVTLALCEELWRNRDKLSALLDSRYIPNDE